MFRYIVLLVVVAATSCLADNNLDVTLLKTEMCKEYPDTPIKLYPTTKRVNGTVTLVNGKGIVPIDVDENVNIEFLLERQEKGQWTKYLSVQKRNPCVLLDKYLGEIWHDLEKAVDIAPGTCPLPKGNYEVKDHMVDFKKFPMSTNLKGPLRFTAKATKDAEVISCMYGELELN